MRLSGFADASLRGRLRNVEQPLHFDLLGLDPSTHEASAAA